MPKCRYCRERFYAPIALGLHGWTRKDLKRCPTKEEMVQAGWHNYHGQWLSGKPEWVAQEEQETANG